MLVGGIFFGLDGPDRFFGDDDEPSPATSDSPDPAPSDTAPTTEAPTAEPTDEPTETPSDPANPTVDLTGGFSEIGGQRLKEEFANAVALRLTTAGLTGSLGLVIDSSLNFGEEEPVCFTVTVDIDDPLPFSSAEKGHVVVDAKVPLVVGYTDGPCRSANSARTETREARLLFDYTAGKSAHDGVLALDSGDLLFTVGGST